jgi:hypothetical protein
MPYEVNVDEKNEIINVRVWGPAARGDHLTARNEAAKLCDKWNYKKLLIDLKDLKTGKGISTMGCYRFGESLTKGILPLDIRIAHVMPGDKEAHKAVELTTSIAQSRGGMVREFKTPAQAKKWLQA